MILGIATVVVLVLVAVALLPARKRDRDGTQSGGVANPFTRQSNFRQQQVQEEADAVAGEYQRRADEAWREELGEKAATLLKSPDKPTSKSSTTRKS